VIPQYNSKTGDLAHKTELDMAIERVLNSGWYIPGEEEVSRAMMTVRTATA